MSKEIGDLRIELCPACRSGRMKEKTRAESCLLPSVTCHLLRCENEHCRHYAWVNLVNADSPIGLYISRKPSAEVTENAYSLKVRERQISQAPDSSKCTLPAELMTDFHEACMCFNIGAYRAAAAMARRTMECALLHNGAKRRPKIADMIADLVRQGQIGPELESLCDDIRVFGKHGAHHTNKEIDRKDAETAISFTDFIVTWLYGNVVRL